MTVYMEIAVNVPQVSGVFHYHLPAELEGQVQPGHLVEVPFGRVRVQGVVLGSVDEPAVAETRPVFSLIDRQAVLTTAQIALAQHLSESNLAPLAAFIDLMLPPGLSQQADTLYSIDRSRSAARLSDTQRRLLAVLDKRGGSLTGRQIDRALPRLDWRAVCTQPGSAGFAHITSRFTCSLGAPQACAHGDAGMFPGRSTRGPAQTWEGRLARAEPAAKCDRMPVARAWVGRCFMDVRRERRKPARPAPAGRPGIVNLGRKPGMARPLAGCHSNSYRAALTSPATSRPAGMKFRRGCRMPQPGCR